ncbi:dihydrofolate reductase family protein [Streptomyces sp. NPDC052051]|uniref:dihydrofolate reductase family protein n=1 Tax=Streptomyces sp. NPDC052051 TaxID=3154649 RepID=UPI00341D6B7F
MGKLTVTAFLTLDGVHQGPGGPNEDTSDGFTQGGWSVPYGDEDFGRFMAEVFDRAGAFLLGRRTYEVFVAHWPKLTDPADPIASRLNSRPKYVTSQTLGTPSWAGTTVLRGDLAKEVTDLKERTEGELQVHGSATLVRSLLALDLVDTLHLLTCPLILGSGHRLFAESTLPTAFDHIEARTTAKGVTIHSYDRAGRPRYGSYELPENARRPS